MTTEVYDYAFVDRQRRDGSEIPYPFQWWRDLETVADHGLQEALNTQEEQVWLFNVLHLLFTRDILLDGEPFSPEKSAYKEENPQPFRTGPTATLGVAAAAAVKKETKKARRKKEHRTYLDDVRRERRTAAAERALTRAPLPRATTLEPFYLPPQDVTSRVVAQEEEKKEEPRLFTISRTGAATLAGRQGQVLSNADLFRLVAGFLQPETDLVSVHQTAQALNQRVQQYKNRREYLREAFSLEAEFYRQDEQHVMTVARALDIFVNGSPADDWEQDAIRPETFQSLFGKQQQRPVPEGPSRVETFYRRFPHARKIQSGHAWRDHNGWQYITELGFRKWNVSDAPGISTPPEGFLVLIALGMLQAKTVTPDWMMSTGQSVGDGSTSLCTFLFSPAWRELCQQEPPVSWPTERLLELMKQNASAGGYSQRDVWTTVRALCVPSPRDRLPRFSFSSAAEWIGSLPGTTRSVRDQVWETLFSLELPRDRVSTFVMFLLSNSIQHMDWAHDAVRPHLDEIVSITPPSLAKSLLFPAVVEAFAVVGITDLSILSSSGERIVFRGQLLESSHSATALEFRDEKLFALRDGYRIVSGGRDITPLVQPQTSDFDGTHSAYARPVWNYQILWPALLTQLMTTVREDKQQLEEMMRDRQDRPRVQRSPVLLKWHTQSEQELFRHRLMKYLHCVVPGREAFSLFLHQCVRLRLALHHDMDWVQVWTTMRMERQFHAIRETNRNIVDDPTLDDELCVVFPLRDRFPKYDDRLELGNILYWPRLEMLLIQARFLHPWWPVGTGFSQLTSFRYLADAFTGVPLPPDAPDRRVLLLDLADTVQKAMLPERLPHPPLPPILFWVTFITSEFATFMTSALATKWEEIRLLARHPLITRALLEVYPLPTHSRLIEPRHNTVRSIVQVMNFETSEGEIKDPETTIVEALMVWKVDQEKWEKFPRTNTLKEWLNQVAISGRQRRERLRLLPELLRYRPPKAFAHVVKRRHVYHQHTANMLHLNQFQSVALLMERVPGTPPLVAMDLVFSGSPFTDKFAKDYVAKFGADKPYASEEAREEQAALWQY